MKRSLLYKIRSHTLALVLLSAVIFIVTVTASMYGIRVGVIRRAGELGAAAAEMAKQTLITQRETELAHIAEGRAALVNELLSAIATETEYLAYTANAALLNDSYDEETIMNMLSTVVMENLKAGLAMNGMEVAVYYGTESGMLFLRDTLTDNTPSMDVTDRPWYIAAKEANSLIWTDIYQDREGRGLSITCAAPYYWPDGSIAGVAGVGMLLGGLADVVTETSVGETGAAFVLNERGEVIIEADMEEDADGNYIRKDLLNSEEPSVRETAQKMTEGQTGIDRITIDGTDMIIAYCRLKTLPWSYAIMIETSEVIAPALGIEADILEIEVAAVKSIDEGIARNTLFTAGFLTAIIAFVMYIIRRYDKEKAYEADKIKEAHEQLREVLDMLPVGIRILAVEDWSLLYANKASLEIFGCTEEIWRERKFTGFEFMPKYQPDGKKTSEIFEETADKDKFMIELECLRYNGTPFIARFHSANIKYHGKSASLAVVEDMTAEKARRDQLENAAKREQEANQLKSRFLAAMSHEIRTPMNAILGIAELQLRNKELPVQTAEAIQRIYESGNLLLSIINDILDVSKIEADKLEIIPARYNLLSLINDTVQLYRFKSDSKPIEFKLDIAVGVPIDLYGDEVRIKQIIGNILSNAYKYTNSGCVTYEVFYEYEDDTVSDLVTIIFRISDTGGGMTDEQLSVLFNEYTRFNLEANREVTGAGLGMFITKRLIDAMGGVITVTSEPGRGSVFTVYLPQKRSGDAVYTSSMQDKLWEIRYKTDNRLIMGEDECEYLPDGKVLIVDDVVTNLYVAEGMMQPYGMRIDLAESGFEAIDKIKAGNVYDIIFMDHMMPKLDGVKATQIIREMGYTNCIIALTANAVAGEADKYLESGFDGFVSKPISTIELDNILMKYVKNKH